MNKLKKYYIINFIIVLSLVLTSCGNKKGNEYETFLNDFYDTYFEIAKTIDVYSPKNVANSMAVSEVQDDINNLKDLLNDIKDKVPKDKERNYKELEQWYQDLVIISDKKYEDWWGVTLEERFTVQNTLLDIAIKLSDWEDEESGIIWDQ
ncbi:hypothetical protein AN1V17_40700 [Vallitalea sediminicola]